jgi:hypothetical protein
MIFALLAKQASGSKVWWKHPHALVAIKIEGLSQQIVDVHC